MTPLQSHDRGHAISAHTVRLPPASVAIRRSLRPVAGVASATTSCFKKMAPSSITQSRPCASYQVTLKRAGAQSIPYQPRNQSRGSPPLDCAPGLKHRAILTACYAAGARVGGGQPAIDIDSRRQLIRIHQGKGRKDRYVMLSAGCLRLLANDPSRHPAVASRGSHPYTPFPARLACHKAQPVPSVQTPQLAATFAVHLSKPAPAPSNSCSAIATSHRPHPAPRRLQGLYHHQSPRPAPPAAIR